MSKKWMCAIGAFWVCLSIAGCAGGTQSNLAETERGPYTDGTYTVRMPEYDQDGWQEYGIVTVADGFIAEVAYDALNENGGKKSQDPSYRDNMAVGNAVNGLPAAYPEQAYEALLTAFRTVQYDPERVETVAGATVSSQNFKRIMAALMVQVKKGAPGETALPIFQDGIYEVQMPDYDNGWKDFVRVTITGGEVEKVEYDGRDEDGALKSDDEKYRKDMIAGNAAKGLPETYPADYGQKLADAYLASGSVEEMDGVAGATISTNHFKKLVRHALINARLGRDELATAPLFEDGQYRAQLREPADGWTEFVVLTIQDNAVLQIVFDAEDEQGNYRSKSPLEESEEGPDPSVIYPAIIEEFIQKQYLPEEMETIAGASRSTSHFKRLVTAALENALYGSDETALVDA